MIAFKKKIPIRSVTWCRRGCIYGTSDREIKCYMITNRQFFYTHSLYVTIYVIDKLFLVFKFHFVILFASTCKYFFNWVQNKSLEINKLTNKQCHDFYKKIITNKKQKQNTKLIRQKKDTCTFNIKPLI